MKLLMRDEAKGREHTIFVTIFSALMVMLAISAEKRSEEHTSELQSH